ncbi:unnamed protein product [Cylicocyclus nassatus]|uniref:Lipid-binding serum glycoprotein C-terminal domain-containing protein n=1 Tax=Cylicocyclus nassatus TaxID=53992 RepID=A0AA36H265_CYLNA|nr:unnamed protein product [Cylicocyclus nassatus]
MLAAAVFFLLFTLISASELGATFGDAAVSQLVRHAAAKVLQEPRIAELTLKTRESPSLGSLAHLDITNRIAYKNLSVVFYDDSLHVVVDRLSVLTHGNLSEVFWPFALGEQVIDVGLELHRGEVRLDVEETSLSMGDCLLIGSELAAAAPGHWIVDKGVSAIASLVRPVLDSVLCNALRTQIGSMEASNVMRFPVHELIPSQLRRYVTKNDTTLYCRLKNLKVNEHQLTARAQLQWVDINDTPVVSLLEESTNATFLDLQLNGDDLVTIWLEDGIINELLDQVDWTFEWMNEQLPVTSPVIPPDSREFLTTLCTECYFQVNVGARGRPSLIATNSSLVLEKRDRVHLRVVNPNRNLTSVFVSFVLTVQAEMRPSFDGGILRTLVQLLDTHIEMEVGAFPKTWGIFMQDLMRGMIMDMLWPEIKNAIEELSYGKGVRISRACGVDPNEISLDIGEGNFALTSRLELQHLDMDKCLQDLKSSLPSTSKIFQKIER